MAVVVDESRYEMRLALVLNGGVSLAVWMGGVTAEIDHMRRAAYPDLLDGDSDPVLELWERLLKLLRVRLIVDVIAGASAGGLNGAVLAAAIARAHPLPELRDVWLSVGSIANLAGTEDQRPGVDRLSVLDGDLLTASIAKVFADMKPTGGTTRPRSLTDGLAQEAKLPRSVTLFTTATSMRGQGEEFTDSTNQRFTQVEYRVLCRFRRSLLGDDEFKDDKETNWRLTRAARASASFPAAFEPTFFRASEQAVGEPPQAAQVAMGTTATIAGSRWMIDGGVLDNEPFAPVLDRIARRPIIRDVDRIVAYIDPEDATAPTGNDDITKPPGMIETVLAAMNLPRETNLLNQLGRLEQMKREVDVDGDSDVTLLKRAFAGSLDEAARELRPIYLERTRAAIAHEIRLAVQSGRSTDDPSVPIDDLPLPDASKAPDGRWDKSVSAAERMLRIALRLTRSAAGNGPNNAEISDALFAISVSLMQLSQLRVAVFAEAVNALAGGKTPFELSDDDIYRTWCDALTPERRALIAAVVAGGLRPFVVASVWPPKVAPPGNPDAQREVFAAACEKIEVVRQAAAPISAYHPVPAFRFCRFGANVGTPFWLEGAPIADKLMGLRLGHFGGFLLPEWRKYDWMWGRLDGATHLVMMLLARLRVEPALPDKELRAGLHEWVGDDYRGALDAALAAFLKAPPPPATPVGAITDLTRELVRPLHRAIFCTEFGLDPATGHKCDTPQDENQAPSLAEIDDRITAHLESDMEQVTKVDVAALADSEDGRKVIGQLGAAALRALGDDAALPAQDRLRPVLQVGADVVLAATQPGTKRTIFRGGYLTLVALFAVLPFILDRVFSGGWWVGVANAGCGIALGVLLAASILVFPKHTAAIVRFGGKHVRGWPVSSVIERGVEKLP
jgi:predicted acylesterase/phospholipase RssA